jgi:sulfhydrogenase subunit gamma (sulfur reductase)
MTNPFLPREAEILERTNESHNLFSLRLRFTDADYQAGYRFEPGQFNMLYLHGVGEVPISIVSDPSDEHIFDHTIRVVGSVSRGLAELQVGDKLGVRGPYGRGWPVVAAEGSDVVIVTGGLGCAPSVSLIEYVIRRRERYGRIYIIQGVKHSADLIWHQRYEAWRQTPDTEVFLTADSGDSFWPWHRGPVTQFFDRLDFNPRQSTVMMCGPEGMMLAVARDLLGRGVDGQQLWMSMERNMHCALGSCGRCQLGSKFVCRDGPVFNYAELAPYLGHKGI